MSDLFGTPHCWFSHAKAHIVKLGFIIGMNFIFVDFIDV